MRFKLETEYITLAQLLKVCDVISSGGQAKEYLNTSQELPDTLLSADRLYVSDISFRSKEKGWKEYMMTIKLKEQE